MLHRHAAVHVGVATQTEGGLLVPVIRHAEALDLWQSAAELRRLAAAARAGKASRDELTGSTITITSLGALGGLAATPVINHPEVAIIGVNRIAERPVVHQGQIAIRKMMNLSSSFDHRIVDGWEAASFIQRIKPARTPGDAVHRLTHAGWIDLWVGVRVGEWEEDDMPETLRPRVLVVGGGPGGYVAAIRAGQLGLDTVLVEQRAARRHLPVARLHPVEGADPCRRQIFRHCRCGGRRRQRARHRDRRAAASRFRPHGRVEGRHRRSPRRAASPVCCSAPRCASSRAGRASPTPRPARSRPSARRSPVAITAEHVILATGSEPAPLPVLPFGGDVISSTEALSLPEIPKNLVVVGAGYIGLELGTAFRKLGAAVTIVEAADRILPRYDEALTRPVRRWLTRNGVTLHLGATVTGRDGDGRLAVETASGKLALDADKILVTVGRRPLTEGWGLEEMARGPRRPLRQGR